MLFSCQKTQDCQCEIRETISDIIQRDPYFSKFTLQILSLKPVALLTYNVTITLSSATGTLFTFSYVQDYLQPTRKHLLEAFKEIEFKAAMDEMFI